MPRKTFTSTGRIDLPADILRVIALPAAGKHRQVEIVIDSKGLGGHGFPLDASVSVLAHRRHSEMTIDCGTVGLTVVSPVVVLDEIDRVGSVLFQLRVSKGIYVLGMTRSIASITLEERNRRRVDLLPMTLEDMGERLFALSDDVSVQPVLRLNRNVPGIEDRLINDHLFRGAVLPVVFEQVLRRLTADRPEDGEGDWRNRWMSFCTDNLNVVEYDYDNDEPEEREAWIRESVEAFFDIPANFFASKASFMTNGHSYE